MINAYSKQLRCLHQWLDSYLPHDRGYCREKEKNNFLKLNENN